MFIRKTATRNKSTHESYFTHRLVTSERAGKQVRQITLLNLGRHFDLPQDDWPRLCARIDALLAGQTGIPRLKIVSPPLALKNQADSLGLRHTDHHQRGAECCHRVFWVSSMKRSLRPLA
jgi:hypothetical protein